MKVIFSKMENWKILNNSSACIGTWRMATAILVNRDQEYKDDWFL